jgi:hypothetical protein
MERTIARFFWAESRCDDVEDEPGGEEEARERKA